VRHSIKFLKSHGRIVECEEPRSCRINTYLNGEQILSRKEDARQPSFAHEPADRGTRLATELQLDYFRSRDLLERSSPLEASYPGDTINAEEYFLGSVVIVDNAISHLLLDGQQRLATSSILLSVVRDYLKRSSRDAATRIQTRYLSDFDDAADRTTYKITLNTYDRDFFKREILESRDGDYAPPEPAIESHRLIRLARAFFEAQFDASFARHATPEDAHRWALRICTVLTSHMSVVAVLSEDEDNAASVFETLNDRGIGLSAPDLLRNLLLRRAPERERQEIIDLWREILEMEGEPNLKTFLRHYWVSRYGDIKTQSLYREMKTRIVAENISSLILSRSLQDAAGIYESLLLARDDNNEIAGLLADVNSLGAASLIQLFCRHTRLTPPKLGLCSGR
jgi:hypothetical protein